MGYKISVKKLSDQVDQILNNTYIGGARKKKTKISKKKVSKTSKSKKYQSRAKNIEENELKPYLTNLINLRRSSKKKSKTKKSKKSKMKRLPAKLIEFGRLRDEVSKIIDKKGKIAMQVAKVVKDDVQKNFTSEEIDKDYKGFINKAIDHLKKNSSHYIKIAANFAK